MPQQTTNHYGDMMTISGEGHQVAIGVQGSVTQISGPPPIDPARFATAAQQLLDLLDQLPVSDDERDELRADAEDVLDIAENPAPIMTACEHEAAPCSKCWAGSAPQRPAGPSPSSLDKPS